METYIAPADGSPEAPLTRQQVLAALAEAGVTVAHQNEEPATGRLKCWWTLSFQGTDAWLQCQETDRGVVFVTLEQSVFDNTPIPDRICGAFESLGWQVDEENAG